jgi:hypothetical protein
MGAKRHNSTIVCLAKTAVQWGGNGMLYGGAKGAGQGWKSLKLPKDGGGMDFGSSCFS